MSSDRALRPVRPHRRPLVTLLALAPLAGAAMLAGCDRAEDAAGTSAGAGSTSAASDGRPRVVATAWHLESLASALAGDAVAVHAPLPADESASAWKPGVDDVIAMQESDLVVFNGAGLSSWRLSTSLPSKVVVVTSDQERDQWLEDHDHHHDHDHGHGDHEDHDHGEHDGHDHGEHDDHDHDHGDHEGHDHGEHDDHDHDGDGVPDHAPQEHVHHAPCTWLDPAIAQRQARTLADALIEVAPRQRNFIEERFQEIGAELEEQASELRALGERMRDAGVVLVAAESHVYHYIARALGLEMESPHLHWSDADAEALEQEVLPLARAAGGAIVLVPTAPNAEQSGALEPAGARAALVDPMLRRGDRAADATFVSAMRANVDALRAAVDDLLDG